MSQRSETGGCQGSGSREIAVPTASYAIGIFQLFAKQELPVPSKSDRQKTSLIPHNHHESALCHLARLSLPTPALTKALLSRLRERCHTVTIEGPCIRPQTG